jgi:DNA-binding CsgD family transcriptional regulator
VEATASLEHLASILDPAEELDTNERLQLASRALARFERYIQPVPDGCRLWSGSLADGYGQFYLNGRLFLSRRLAYQLQGGCIGAHERIFSTCGVRACVNYRHLETRPVATPTLPGDRFTARWAQTEAGSWFLGLWTADGYLSRDASMSLALKDHDCIQLAARALGLQQGRVGLHRRLDQARIRFGVKWFLPRLAVLGITPGPKTGRERAPLGLENNRHFWRGVVDGDGWMSPQRRVIGLVTASPLLRDQFSAFLHETIGCVPTTSERNDGTPYQLSLSGSNAAALALLLYEGSTFALPRKRAAAGLVVERDRGVRRRAQKTVARNERIIAAYTDGCSAYEIAIRETISAATVYYVLNRAQVTRRPREWYAAQKQRCGRGHLLDEHNTRIERTGVGDAEPAPRTVAAPGPRRGERKARPPQAHGSFLRRMQHQAVPRAAKLARRPP